MSASHPCFCKGWATFPLTGCDLPKQGKGWCTSDRNGWESTQVAWPLMGIGTCTVRTGKARNGNFKTQMFHPGQDYCHSFPWDQPISWTEFTSFPFISLERGSLLVESAKTEPFRQNVGRSVLSKVGLELSHVTTASIWGCTCCGATRGLCAPGHSDLSPTHFPEHTAVLTAFSCNEKLWNNSGSLARDFCCNNKLWLGIYLPWILHPTKHRATTAGWALECHNISRKGWNLKTFPQQVSKTISSFRRQHTSCIRVL